MGAREHHPAPVIWGVCLTLALALLPPAPAAAKQGKSLDKIVGDTVRAAYPTLHNCFRKALARDRKRSGTIFFQVTLGREDRVAKAEAVRDELDHLPTARCLVALLVKWTFPGAGAAGAEPGSEIVIPLTLKPDDHQYSVLLKDVDPGKSGAAVIRPLLTNKSVGSEKANVAHLTLDGEWEARAPAASDLALVILDGTAGPDLGAGSALWLPAGSRRELKGKATALLIMSASAREAGATVSVVKPPRARSLKGGKLKITPLLGRPGAGTGGTYVGLLEASGGFQVTPHHHETSDELIFVLQGTGKATLLDRQELMVPGSAANMPARVGHSLLVIKPMKVVQIYAPGGPEQRFFKAAPSPGGEKRKTSKKRRKP